jgi:hypothetical protein
MSNLIEHAKKELEMAGLFNKDGDFYGGMTGNAVMELIKVFDKQGHSGMSASLVISLFKELADFKPINPIKNEPDEWTEYAEGMFQHKRLSSLFKDGADGRPYYLDAIVWDEGGNCFNGTVGEITSRQFVKLPFLPKTFYVKVNKEREIIDKDVLQKAFEYYDHNPACLR